MDEDDSQEHINALEQRNQALLRELNKLRSKPHGKIAYILIIIGSIIFAVSLDYSQSLAAFLSLALIFWGVLFLYVKPADFVRQEILFAVLEETNEFYSQILHSLRYEGRPYYYSPKTLSDFNNVYLILDKNQPMDDELINSESNRITPIGLELSNLIEEESKINFSTIDLERMFSLLKKILVEDLEIVKKFESKIDDNNIKIEITDSILNSKKNEEYKLLDYLSNSIACSIAKSTHKPVIIKDVYYELGGRTTVTEYEILENEAM